MFILFCILICLPALLLFYYTICIYLDTYIHHARLTFPLLLPTPQRVLGIYCHHHPFSLIQYVSVSVYSYRFHVFCTNPNRKNGQCSNENCTTIFYLLYLTDTDFELHTYMPVQQSNPYSTLLIYPSYENNIKKETSLYFLFCVTANGIR